MVYGNVGSLQRMDFTLIGDNVNIAARLEANAPLGGVLISRSTYEQIYTKIKVTPAQKMKIKGKAAPVEVYELIEKIDEDAFMPRGMQPKNDYNIREQLRISVKAMAILIKDDKPYQGLLRDISIGGVSLSLSMSVNFKIDEEIRLNFKLNDTYNFKNITGIVKHISKISSTNGGSTRQIVGIMFMELSEDNYSQLAKYIDKKCVNWQQIPLAEV